MGVKGSRKLMFLALLIAELCSGSHVKISFLITNETLNFMEAKSFCQRNQVDLITLNIVKLTTAAKLMEEEEMMTAWIDQQGNSEVGNGNEDSESHNANCRFVQAFTGRSYRSACSAKHPCVCYEDNLVVVPENKTWDGALRYCRRMTTPTRKYDLLSIRNVSDGYVRDKILRATTDEVWTGLRFLEEEWIWLDGNMVDHQNELPDCPTQWKRCGTMSKYDTNQWIIRDCSERRNFICYYTE
ncbi:uncharacterized protein LOC133440907 [Cololabis saira]|uniref:uncharacterized protein LOC133440907 n=1 Tax=Cololabis saira TaxID=129043 RepID=UPI002AD205F9|nr:uncharacterized protein LOC133440907 [Cololabis saira]